MNSECKQPELIINPIGKAYIPGNPNLAEGKETTVLLHEKPYTVKCLSQIKVRGIPGYEYEIWGPDGRCKSAFYALAGMLMTGQYSVRNLEGDLQGVFICMI